MLIFLESIIAARSSSITTAATTSPLWNLISFILVLPEGAHLPEHLEILHRSTTGRLQQLILRGKAEEISAQLAACEPIYQDMLPLTLEEIFIYELGGTEHEVKAVL